MNRDEDRAECSGSECWRDSGSLLPNFRLRVVAGLRQAVNEPPPRPHQRLHVRPVSRCHCRCAISSSLNAINRPFVREPVPFITRCRSRTVANGDSIRFDVRRCRQCSAKQSEKASRAPRSAARQTAAFGCFALNSATKAPTDFSAVLVSAYVISRSARFARGRQPLRRHVQHVRHLVAPVALRRRLRPHVPRRRPEAAGTVARRRRCPRPPTAHIPRHGDHDVPKLVTTERRTRCVKHCCDLPPWVF